MTGYISSWVFQSACGSYWERLSFPRLIKPMIGEDLHEPTSVFLVRHMGFSSYCSGVGSMVLHLVDTG